MISAQGYFLEWNCLFSLAISEGHDSAPLIQKAGEILAITVATIKADHCVQ